LAGTVFGKFSLVRQWLRFLRQLGCNGAFECQRRRVCGIELKRPFYTLGSGVCLIFAHIDAGQDQQRFYRGAKSKGSLGLGPCSRKVLLAFQSLRQSRVSVWVAGVESERFPELAFSFDYESLREEFTRPGDMESSVGTGILR
jgi:hypothetical protein